MTKYTSPEKFQWIPIACAQKTHVKLGEKIVHKGMVYIEAGSKTLIIHMQYIYLLHVYNYCMQDLIFKWTEQKKECYRRSL